MREGKGAPMLKEIDYGDARPVDGYGPGFFRVGGVVLCGPHLLWPGGNAPWGGIADEAPLMGFAGAVDVLFIGTGSDLVPLPPALRRRLEEAGLGVEAMSSPSAARTYNVLLSEGRRIAAALVPVGDAAPA